jgi:hypothetical protein
MNFGTELPLLLASDSWYWVRSGCTQRYDTWLGPKRNLTRRSVASSLSFRQKPKARCRTAEMMMRLPAERAIARTV